MKMECKPLQISTDDDNTLVLLWCNYQKSKRRLISQDGKEASQPSPSPANQPLSILIRLLCSPQSPKLVFKAFAH